MWWVKIPARQETADTDENCPHLQSGKFGTGRYCGHKKTKDKVTVKCKKRSCPIRISEEEADLIFKFRPDLSHLQYIGDRWIKVWFVWEYATGQELPYLRSVDTSFENAEAHKKALESENTLFGRKHFISIEQRMLDHLFGFRDTESLRVKGGYTR